MDWNSINRGKFRKALIEQYVQKESIELFVKDHIVCSFSDIDGRDTEIWTSGLLDKAERDGWIKELFSCFCKENKDSAIVEKLCNELQIPLAGLPSVPLAETSELFNCFVETDLNIVRNAFCRAFSTAYAGSQFRDMQRGNKDTQLDSLAQIKDVLESYEPKLAVEFAKHVIVALRKNDHTRDVSVLEGWRDRNAKEHKLSPLLSSSGTKESPNYLLVSLKETSQITQGCCTFSVFSELYISSIGDFVEFGATAITCSVDQIGGHLSVLIKKAEDVSSDYGNGRVTLELFLPAEHLDIDAGSWEILVKDSPLPLWKRLKLMVRSFDRAGEKRDQTNVRHKWQMLEAGVRDGRIHDHFHHQDTPPCFGDLRVDLEEKLGLKLLAELPETFDERLNILYDIIDSAVPIALWFSSTKMFDQYDEGGIAEKLDEFDRLLHDYSCLTDFSKLAHQWRLRRRHSPNKKAMPHLRLLCDHPDRWPKKPFYKDPIKPPSQSSA